MSQEEKKEQDESQAEEEPKEDEDEQALRWIEVSWIDLFLPPVPYSIRLAQNDQPMHILFSWFFNVFQWFRVYD